MRQEYNKNQQDNVMYQGTSANPIINSMKAAELKKSQQEVSARLQIMGNFQKKMHKKMERSQERSKFCPNKKTFLYLFMGILIAEFSIALSLLLLLQASSKLNSSSLWTFMGICVILFILVLVCFCRVLKKELLSPWKVDPEPIIESPLPFDMQEISCPTLPKIRLGKISKNGQKTKKFNPDIFFPRKEGNIQTIRKMNGHLNNFQEENKENLDQGKQDKSLKILVGVKCFQNLIELVFYIVLLGTVSKPTVENFTLNLALIIAGFILILASFWMTWKIYLIFSLVEPIKNLPLKEKRKNLNGVNPINECIQSSKPPTALSIEHRIQQLSQCRSNAVSIQEARSPSGSNKTYQNIVNIDVKERKQGQKGLVTFQREQKIVSDLFFEPQFQLKVDNMRQQLERIQNKKSVLKSTRPIEPVRNRNATVDSYLFKEDEEIGERRRVQIDEKKTQYFEYAKSSPGNSFADEGEETKSQKNRYRGSRSRVDSRYKKKREVKLKGTGQERLQPPKNRKTTSYNRQKRVSPQRQIGQMPPSSFKTNEA